MVGAARMPAPCPKGMLRPMPYLAQALFVAVNATWVMVCGLAILRLDFTGLQWLTVDVPLDVFPC